MGSHPVLQSMKPLGPKNLHGSVKTGLTVGLWSSSGSPFTLFMHAVMTFIFFYRV
jgi:hypothetical protein